jgi:hypothetical protein
MLRRSARLKRRAAVTVGGPAGWIFTSAICLDEASRTEYKAGLIEVKRRYSICLWPSLKTNFKLAEPNYYSSLVSHRVVAIPSTQRGNPKGDLDTGNDKGF